MVLYEGSFLKETFTVSSANPDRRYILGASGIDTKTIRVRVRPTQQSNTVFEYRLSSNLNDINSFPRVYFIQEVADERYEIIFGDGVFGQKLEDQNFIEISYITTNGADGNGVTGFNYIGQLESDTGASLNRYVSPVITTVSAYGGSGIESVESIKKYAPRVYASQNRAVTSADYETIVKQIYPEAESVSAFGGEDLDPPQFGKVFITVKPTNSNFIADPIKDNLKRELKKYGVAGIIPEFIDLKYLYLEVFSTVYYNDNLVKDASTVTTTVSDIITEYADSTELNKYGARFKYSKFLKIIDDSHRSITSNITSIQMRRDLRPALNAFANYEICFGNAFHIKNPKTGYNIKSSGFNVSGILQRVYLGDLPNGDGKKGSLFLFRLDSEQQPVVVRNGVGTIDYEKGEILLSSLNIISTAKVKVGLPVIEISVSPTSNDVIGKQDLYLQLDTSKTEVKSVNDSIESGGDVSGFSYLVTSSYLNGTIVRA